MTIQFKNILFDSQGINKKSSTRMYHKMNLYNQSISLTNYFKIISNHSNTIKTNIEGDAQNVVKAIQGKLKRGFHNQILVENVRAAASGIPQVFFDFCYREANNVAHRLAKWASTSICSNVWRDGGPLWITDIVLSDFAN